MLFVNLPSKKILIACDNAIRMINTNLDKENEHLKLKIERAQKTRLFGLGWFVEQPVLSYQNKIERNIYDAKKAIQKFELLRSMAQQSPYVILDETEFEKIRIWL